MKIPNYSDADFLTNCRFWLIKLIAGRSVIMLNAEINIAKDNGAMPFITRGIHGGYFNNVSFPAQRGMILEINQK